jgi:hypothetical protein
VKPLRGIYFPFPEKGKPLPVPVETVEVSLPPLSPPKPRTPRPQNVFFNFSEACPTPGCQALRVMYAKELEQLGSGCTNCALAALRQKYNNAYRKLLAST